MLSHFKQDMQVNNMQKQYKIEIVGQGGELVMGRVDRDIYEYFEDNDISIYDFIDDEDNELCIPVEYLFIKDGEWNDVDDLAHENGANMNKVSDIVISDMTGKEVWRHNLDLDELRADGVQYEEIFSCYTDLLEEGVAIFTAQSCEKGLFFSGSFTANAAFDPSNLLIEYSDIEGSNMFSSIQYDDHYIDNKDYSTTTKDLSFDFFINTI